MGSQTAKGLKVPVVREETRRTKKELEKDAEAIIEAVEVNSIGFTGACGSTGQKRRWSQNFHFLLLEKNHTPHSKYYYSDKKMVALRMHPLPGLTNVHTCTELGLSPTWECLELKGAALEMLI